MSVIVSECVTMSVIVLECVKMSGMRFLTWNMRKHTAMRWLHTSKVCCFSPVIIMLDKARKVFLELLKHWNTSFGKVSLFSCTIDKDGRMQVHCTGTSKWCHPPKHAISYVWPPHAISYVWPPHAISYVWPPQNASLYHSKIAGRKMLRNAMSNTCTQHRVCQSKVKRYPDRLYDQSGTQTKRCDGILAPTENRIDQSCTCIAS